MGVHDPDAREEGAAELVRSVFPDQGVEGGPGDAAEEAVYDCIPVRFHVIRPCPDSRCCDGFESNP